MLKQRVITALVLLGLLIPALLASDPRWFALLTLAFIGAAGWEWMRLNGAGSGLAIVLGVALAAACAGALAAGWTQREPTPAWGLAAVAWVLGGTLALRSGVAGWPRLPRVLRGALGLVLLWLAWLALAQARALGLNFILSVFCLVWMADIAAYFGGRRFGRRKLAPAISPGKSWEGAISGLLGVLVLALVWLLLDGEGSSLYGRLANAHGPVLLVAGVLLLAGMSVVGDLFESLVKRAAGAKDSSALLPGHGGVLDRVDALLPVFPIALALAAL
ncbi:phosphatidate cytidylyltransferase [Azohydromonas caseinilytica]|uniref:Phosphatidate cytidylyltransferase n=1 Tax=Azohydromonas caseinilytica TaxID=2728836 RepID=A0A848F6H4_9BURK|nr:phosphatidate cytidylyltransferase [Azohydromonas caseinilytica]NML14296.1 phosphatidate cytidylyltransferase [Azohydromonas caseinilytica]